jgi:hypothetical protein
MAWKLSHLGVISYAEQNHISKKQLFFYICLALKNENPLFLPSQIHLEVGKFLLSSVG